MSAGSKSGIVPAIELLEEKLTQQIIGAAIEVHRHWGPGLLESAYEECLCRELALRGLPFRRQVGLPVVYKGIALDCGYRMDLLVEERIIVEPKCVEALLGVHHAQLLTYLKLRQASWIDVQCSRFCNDEGDCSKGPMNFRHFFSVAPCLRGERNLL